jgi:hypothetical protein
MELLLALNTEEGATLLLVTQVELKNGVIH